MVLVIVSISIIPLLKMIDTHIYMQLQILQAYIAPPIVSVFLLGYFGKMPPAGSNMGFNNWRLIGF